MSSLDDYRDEGPYGDHTGYYNSVEQFPVFTISAITMRREPIYLSTFTGRPPDEPSVLGEALNDVFMPLLHPAVPGDRRFLAAARGLLLPHRRGRDEEGLSRPRQARDDGRLVVPAPVHVHEMGHRRGRRHRRPRLEGRDVGDLHAHGPGARHHRRSRTRRSTISTSPRPRSGLGGKIGLDATNKWPPETKREWGTKIPHERRGGGTRHEEMARVWVAGQRQDDLEIAALSNSGELHRTAASWGFSAADSSTKLLASLGVLLRGRQLNGILQDFPHCVSHPSC